MRQFIAEFGHVLNVAVSFDVEYLCVKIKTSLNSEVNMIQRYSVRCALQSSIG